MPKFEAVIERVEITPGIFKRQPADYTSNESGIGLMALRTEWPITVETEEENLEGVKEAVQKVLDELGGIAFDFTVRLLEKDRERMEMEEEF